jgi:hypothetical protein
MFFYFYVTFALALFLLPLVTPDGIYTLYIAFFAPLMLMCWAITALYFLALLIGLLKEGAWRKVVAVAVLPSLVLAMTVNWATAYQYTANWEHFLMMRPRYDAKVAHLPNNGERFAEFNWGGLAYASRGVVYDETDEIARPQGRQSRRWIGRMKNTDLLCGESEFTAPVEPLGDHYYATSFGC